MQKARCQQLLSRIPSRLIGMNDGLTTLQFIQLTVNPRNVEHLQGGTQDNGTWENQRGQTRTWRNTMIGDGGWGGFDARLDNVRYHSFFDVSPEVSFNRGDIGSWIWTADPLFGHAGSQFYAPIMPDPKVSGTVYAGTGSTVYRTKTFGIGNRSFADANKICNTWIGTFEAQCGDYEPLGSTPLSGPTNVNDGDAIAQVERTEADTSTLWAASTTGRLWVTKNADAEPASSVTWTRLDDDATNDPNRFISSVYVDPANPNRAYVSYSGYNMTTPTTPGHVFRVDFNGTTATWTDMSYDLRDLPVNDLVLDPVTRDLYAATDFGVLKLAAGTQTWTRAARGMPNVEVAGLTIRPGERVLYAATHGLAAWRLNL